jgi:hypothetical protein
MGSLWRMLKNIRQCDTHYRLAVQAKCLNWSLAGRCMMWHWCGETRVSTRCCCVEKGEDWDDVEAAVIPGQAAGLASNMYDDL